MGEIATLYKTPNDKAKRMLAIRFKRDQLREALNKLDEEYDLVRDDLLQEMTKHKVLTLKTENYTISRKNMKTIKVTNDAAVISELQNAGIQPPMIVKWNWRAMGQEAYKQIEMGTVTAADIHVTEYVSIKKAEK